MEMLLIKHSMCCQHNCPRHQYSLAMTRASFHSAMMDKHSKELPAVEGKILDGRIGSFN
jgi:hypothetical protein